MTKHFYDDFFCLTNQPSVACLKNSVWCKTVVVVTIYPMCMNTYIIYTDITMMSTIEEITLTYPATCLRPYHFHRYIIVRLNQCVCLWSRLELKNILNIYECVYTFNLKPLCTIPTESNIHFTSTRLRYLDTRTNNKYNYLHIMYLLMTH